MSKTSRVAKLRTQAAASAKDAWWWDGTTFLKVTSQ
jgi:hypothetical protein